MILVRDLSFIVIPNWTFTIPFCDLIQNIDIPCKDMITGLSDYVRYLSAMIETPKGKIGFSPIPELSSLGANRDFQEELF